MREDHKTLKNVVKELFKEKLGGDGFRSQIWKGEFPSITMEDNKILIEPKP